MERSHVLAAFSLTLGVAIYMDLGHLQSHKACSSVDAYCAPGPWLLHLSNCLHHLHGLGVHWLSIHVLLLLLLQEHCLLRRSHLLKHNHHLLLLLKLLELLELLGRHVWIRLHHHLLRTSWQLTIIHLLHLHWIDLLLMHV